MNYGICTNIDQSYALMDLGLNPDSADMKYDPRWDIPVIVDDEYYDNKLEYNTEFENTDVPSWSLSALRKLIPMGIETKNGTCLFSCHNRLDGSWVYMYHYEDGTVLKQFTGGDVDSAYEMVSWLLENNYIEK